MLRFVNSDERKLSIEGLCMYIYIYKNIVAGPGKDFREI